MAQAAKPQTTPKPQPQAKSADTAKTAAVAHPVPRPVFTDFASI
jgi:hypothetical protein